MTNDVDQARPAAAPAIARRPALTREQVLTAAVAIIDAEGVEALTMRRLGQALDRDPMAIYRHAADKDALLDCVVERVAAELVTTREPDSNGDENWEAVLHRTAHTFRRVALAHPHVVPLLLTRPLSGPIALRPLGSLQLLEELIELFSVAGFDESGALHDLGQGSSRSARRGRSTAPATAGTQHPARAASPPGGGETFSVGSPRGRPWSMAGSGRWGAVDHLWSERGWCFRVSWWPLTGSPLLQPRTIGSYRCRFLLHCGRPVHVRHHPISEVGRVGARWAQAVSVRDVSDAVPLVCAWVYGAASGVRPVGSSAVHEQAAQRAGEAFGAPGHGRQ